MIERDLAQKICSMAEKFPVVTITGPRQSGKSTLVKSLFPSYRYVTLEDEDVRSFATEDPRGFLSFYDNKVILDEVQRAPALFSYIQGVVDSSNETGQYILSGSQNFLLMEAISQSLAGRVAILNLLPLSMRELDKACLLPESVGEFLFTGGYPRIFDRRIDPADYYPNYVQTYLERDVRKGSGILKLAEFERFLGLCADRTGQMLNKEDLARDTGITTKTAESWLSVLEASFIVLRLQPYYRNYGKRMAKTPKLYLYDTGLACNLLGLEEYEEVVLSPYRGALFETAVIAEAAKSYAARGRRAKMYYWRDSAGKEVDLVIERGTKPSELIEIKSSATYTSKFFKNVTELGELMGVSPEHRHVVYAGSESFATSFGHVVSLADVSSIL